jgi:hypothetical protein
VFEGEIEWNYGVVAVSVVIALIAAPVAFWILFRLLSLFPFIEALRQISAIIMAIAVNGMHYTGMAAATFKYVKGKDHGLLGKNTIDGELAAAIVIVLSIVFVVSMLILSTADVRTWYYNLSRIVELADARMEEGQQHADISQEVFLAQYAEIRKLDGSEQAVMRYRHSAMSSGHSGSVSQVEKSSQSFHALSYVREKKSLRKKIIIDGIAEVGSGRYSISSRAGPIKDAEDGSCRYNASGKIAPIDEADGAILLFSTPDPLPSIDAETKRLCYSQSGRVVPMLESDEKCDVV